MTDVPNRQGSADEPLDEAAANRERMRELGRAGGKASGAASRRKRTRTVRDELLEGVKGSKNAVGIAALLSQLPPEPTPHPELELEPDRSAPFIDVVRDWLRNTWKADQARVERLLVEAGILEPEGVPGGEGVGGGSGPGIQ
jgi:general stress protein YciG